MSDIVKRLRAAARHPYMDNTCKVRAYDAHDAAAEIEKLRAALKAIMTDAALTTYKDIRTNVCLVGRDVLSDAALLLKEAGDE